MKICLIYNSAAHYRESIFLQIDREYDCDYVFGSSLRDIKQMDTSRLRGNVIKVNNYFIKNGFYWQSRVQKFLNRKYDAYIILGDTHCLSTWLFCIRAKFTGRSKRIYFWTHGWYGKETRIDRWLKKRFFNMAGGGIFLYGNYARELMIKEGFKADKLFVIHNSLAYERQLELRQNLKKDSIYLQYFGNNAPNLLFVGRLTTIKKLDNVLCAMSKLKEQGHEYNLTLIGDGEVREDLGILSDELNLKKNVWFYGACYDEQQLGQLIYNADLCVSPGNVGLTAMHVMVFGTPVLTHNDFAHQMPEFEAIHDGETGTFFKRDDIDSLALSISRWFEEKASMREEVRRACFQEIDSSWTPQFQIEVLRNNLK